LLVAGADTAQLDPRGDTALSALLGKLVGDVKLLQHTYHWFKPLSRGVDINRRNEEGKSVVDLLGRVAWAAVDGQVCWDVCAACHIGKRGEGDSMVELIPRAQHVGLI